ncbi:hypothetical protein KFL_000840180 [Klebsormidium nitens]|uniref:Post-SET domain-containing protein n=1 Tax=Klebsormidium nitens TaxID=105231 RepID=A0A1Y1HYG8_KLENI|nr:hypothetical protein KFL_000840180 [Klebsormidium nitens]|eukprot:GAQ81576.1 hypothetical protein KFL_000840180 [Klebsormidium nitens]
MATNGAADYVIDWSRNDDRDPGYEGLNPDVWIQESTQFPGEKELVVKALIPKGEIVFTGHYLRDRKGTILTVDQLEALPLEKREEFLHWAVQISDHEFQAATVREDGVPEDFAAFMNHSCDPTIWFHPNDWTMLARRDLHPGDLILLDYSTAANSSPITYLSDVKVMPCLCGTKRCRKLLRKDDYLNKTMWEQYGSHWAPSVYQMWKRDGIAPPQGTGLPHLEE